MKDVSDMEFFLDGKALKLVSIENGKAVFETIESEIADKAMESLKEIMDNGWQDAVIGFIHAQFMDKVNDFLGEHKSKVIAGFIGIMVLAIVAFFVKNRRLFVFLGRNYSVISHLVNFVL